MKVLLMGKQKQKHHAFTIVELLVVIVVIGILVTITIVSYAGITNKANVALIQSDLVNAAKQLESFKITSSTESYPTTIDCTIANSETNLCIEASGSNTYSYVPSNSTNPKTFRLITNLGSLAYYVTNTIPPTIVSAPIVTSPTVANIASTTATLGANIESDGGATITEYGTCWGTTANPTTNCSTIAQLGALTAMSPATIGTGGSPSAIAMSSDGLSIYTKSYPIYIYRRDLSTGALNSVSTISTGGSAGDVAVSPDGKSVYFIHGNGSIYLNMYRHDTNTGLLTALSPATIETGNQATAIAISPDGMSVYVSNELGVIYMYRRDISTGALEALNPSMIATGVALGRIYISPDSKSLYVTSTTNVVYMYRRDISTGALEALNPAMIATGARPTCIVVSPDNLHVYVGNYDSHTISIYSRNADTGLLTSLSSSTTSFNTVRNIAISPDGLSIYALSGSGVLMYVRNPISGLLAALNPLSINSGYLPNELAISPDGTSVYTANNGSNTVSMYSRNTSIPAGIYTEPRTTLPPNTTIYYRGYATNSIGRGYSPDGSFTTAP